MSETAQTLIKAALRSIGAIATGETPTYDELNDGLEAMKLMFRNWSSKNIRLYYTKQETLTMDGSEYYTIGSGGDLDTTRPKEIRGAWHDDFPVKIITEGEFRSIRMSADSSGTVEMLWYSPEYPLGKLYPFPLGGSTLYVDIMIALSDPSAITSDVEFPEEYDDAIKWNLAVRLAPEYGKEPSPTVQNLAFSTLSAVESRNFSNQMNAVKPEVIKLISARYNIDRE
jgi:hypothetical protein